MLVSTDGLPTGDRTSWERTTGLEHRAPSAHVAQHWVGATTDVDAVQRAGHGVEAGSEDDDVEP
jgi:hypothetical protein